MLKIYFDFLCICLLVMFVDVIAKRNNLCKWQKSTKALTFAFSPAEFNTCEI